MQQQQIFKYNPFLQAVILSYESWGDAHVTEYSQLIARLWDIGIT